MKILFAGAAVAGLLAVGAARAEPYVDYTPMKGAWDITQVHVEPNRIDAYLTGLKKSWGPSQEIDKRHGLIDNYWVMVKIDPSGSGANVLLGRHVVTLASLEPDKARDTAIDQENEKALPKASSDQIVKGYNEYRNFLSEGFYQPVEFAK